MMGGASNTVPLRLTLRCTVQRSTLTVPFLGLTAVSYAISPPNTADRVLCRVHGRRLPSPPLPRCARMSGMPTLSAIFCPPVVVERVDT